MIKCDFKPRYKTLHLTNELGSVFYGGVHNVISQIYERRNATTGFLLYDEGDKDFVAEPDVAVVRDTDIPRLLVTLDFDVLVVHHYGYNKIIKPFVGNHPIVFVMHGMPTPEPTPRDYPFGGHPGTEVAYLSLCKESEVIVVASQAEAAKFRRIVKDCADKVVVIPMGVTLPETIQMAPLREERMRLGHIARGDYRKGLLETLRAIRQIPEVELHVACNTADFRHQTLVNDYLEATGIGNRVHFHGFCAGPRKDAFFAHVDAIVVSSLWEPFGYTVIEPALYGRTVITANNSGPLEIVGEDYAYQFDPFVIEEQVVAIRRFMSDPQSVIGAEFDKLASRLRAFDGQRMVEQYDDLFSTVAYQRVMM